ncbi:MAG: class I SAM-dependent methyltransferase [Anaerolineales bacterium]
MNSDLLPFLCHPQTYEPLQWLNGRLVAPKHGATFPIREGIPTLMMAHIPFSHRFWAWVYNRTAFAYDWGVAFAWRLPLGGHPIDRQAYLEKIEIHPGAWVLETAIGTGANLQHLPAHARFVGVDVSFNMLRQCQKNLVRWRREADLIHADAQALPFQAGIFDVVYHMGGLQFTAQPQQALAEALRVTKPGGRIWMIDEAYSIPRLVRCSAGGKAIPHEVGLNELITLVPASADNIHAEWISDGELYLLHYRKPR